MKGALESQDSLVAQRSQQHLFPGSTYSHVSGGDPMHILGLSYEQLRAFHRHCYHPSNARFYTYGDLPLGPHLEKLNEIVLRRFVRAAPTERVPPAARWVQPRTVRDTFSPSPFAAGPAQASVSVSFLMRDATDPFTLLTGRIASSLLLDGPSTPLYQALIQSGLGPDYSANSGFDGSTRDASFGVGLKVCWCSGDWLIMQDIKEKDADNIIQVIMQTLDRVAEVGFQPEASAIPGCMLIAIGHRRHAAPDRAVPEAPEHAFWPRAGHRAYCSMDP